MIRSGSGTVTTSGLEEKRTLTAVVELAVVFPLDRNPITVRPGT